MGSIASSGVQKHFCTIFRSRDISKLNWDIRYQNVAKLSSSRQLKFQLNWDSIITTCLPPQPNPTGIVIICSLKLCTQVYPVRIWTPNLFWTQNFFRPKSFSTLIFFRNQIFLMQNVFWTQIFFALNIFFGPKHF